MSRISEEEWRQTMNKIFELLRDDQYKKMLEYLKHPSTTRKTAKFRNELPQKIIESYGLEESINQVNKAMIEIPRNDPAVQDLLKPFVDKLRNEPEKMQKRKKRKLEDDLEAGGRMLLQNSAAGSNKIQMVADSSGKNKEPGKKRKLEANPKTGLKIVQQNSAAGSKKNQVVSDSSGKNKEPGDLKNPELVKVQPSSSWRKPIAELQNGVDLSQKTVVGKVVKKSDLHTYETKDKQKRFFFYLGIADDSACIKVMVYRMDKYSFFEEGECYNFRNVIVKENMIKFTMNSSTSKFCKDKLDVPKELELKAQMLIYGQDPAVSSEEIKHLDEKKRVSVEGTVTEIGKIDSVVMEEKQTKKNIQKFKLKDCIGSIYITLWGEDIQHLKGVSVGDTVKVTNVMTNHYRGTVSLNSTDSTRIFKLQSAALQKDQIEIIGIKKTGKLQTKLDVAIDGQFKVLSVKSAVLAEALGIQQGSNFEDRVLEKIPCLARAEIKGDTILTFTV